MSAITSTHTYDKIAAPDAKSGPQWNVLRWQDPVSAQGFTLDMVSYYVPPSLVARVHLWAKQRLNELNCLNTDSTPLDLHPSSTRMVSTREPEWIGNAWCYESLKVQLCFILEKRTGAATARIWSWEGPLDDRSPNLRHKGLIVYSVVPWQENCAHPDRLDTFP
ncbi:hypothetical protein HO173_003982 [Letharia columbiana]|uniref:Uncharacterized protein n=1 Tax=Letharia columbiana TaxID=112416 RepID=A0A8H6FZW2_9LECA|nr:uncharacterized protein HO173_003982 [Letharia columbiana]KAF6237781.1 hypothetical protein HO173_003982 [Letharia columbiana]